MEKKTETRESIFEDLKSIIPVMKAKKSDMIFDVYKKDIKNLAQLSAVQELADEEEICIKNFELIIDCGIDTYSKLEEIYSKLEEGVEKMDNLELKGAIYTIYSFVDYSYQEQNNPDFLVLDE
jgi:Zn-dependent M16 (insulinase) family peptidase